MKHYEYEISLFVEDELPLEKKEELFLHLSGCKKCSKVLADYQKIKNNIFDFYETLPSGNIYITPVPNKKNFIRRVVSWKILIPVSVSVLFFVAIIFFMEPGLNQQEINSVTKIRKEVSEKAISDEKVNLNSISEHGENMEQVPIDFLNVTNFNKVINNTIYLEEEVAEELKNASYNYDVVEFNKVINSTFYNNYN